MQLEVSGFAAALAKERGSIAYDDQSLAIPLGRRKGPIKGWTLISKEDAHLGRYYWSADRWGYARRRLSDSFNIRLNREILGLQRGDKRVADHINRDRLDNRRENLRVCTQGENAQNMAVKKGSSKYRGVSYKARDKKWQAYGTADGKMTHLGFFDDEESAHQAALAWRRQHLPYATD